MKPGIQSHMSKNEFTGISFPGISIGVWHFSDDKATAKAEITTMFLHGSQDPAKNVTQKISVNIDIFADGEIDFTDISLSGNE